MRNEYIGVIILHYGLRTSPPAILLLHVFIMTSEGEAISADKEVGSELSTQPNHFSQDAPSPGKSDSKSKILGYAMQTQSLPTNKSSNAENMTMVEETTQARVERLGRERPDVFSSLWKEIGFIFSISMSQVLSVSLTTKPYLYTCLTENRSILYRDLQ